MAYNRELEQTVVISKEHHTMIKELANKDQRKIKNKLELIIQQAYNQDNQ